MGHRTILPAKRIPGFTVVNYTFRAVLNVFFMTQLLAGFCVLLTASLTGFTASLTGFTAWPACRVSIRNSDAPAPDAAIMFS